MDFVHKEKKIDYLNIAIITIVQVWWVMKTKTSPNKRKVTHKQIGPFQHDEKVTDFLMESQVNNNISNRILSFCFKFFRISILDYGVTRVMD
jgi:hypothetical protein